MSSHNVLSPSKGRLMASPSFKMPEMPQRRRKSTVTTPIGDKENNSTLRNRKSITPVKYHTMKSITANKSVSITSPTKPMNLYQAPPTAEKLPPLNNPMPLDTDNNLLNISASEPGTPVHLCRDDSVSQLYSANSSRRTSVCSTPSARLSLASNYSSVSSYNNNREAIQVVIRVRSVDSNNDICVGVVGTGQIMLDKRSFQAGRDGAAQEIINNSNTLNTMQFDRVFNMETTQEQIYNESAVDLINQFVNGWNCTILAYGQTSSGKSHTMLGKAECNESQHKGVLPRAIQQIFNQIQTQQAEFSRANNEVSYSVQLSYLEIYNEKIYDCLEQSQANSRMQQKSLELRENDTEGVFVQGLIKKSVLNDEEALSLVELGSKNRRVGETAHNSVSSRSHAIISLSLEKRITDSRSGASSVTNSKLYLVDLAGSERYSGQNDKQRDEMKNINQSLSCLAKVIEKLTNYNNEANDSNYIPYRDSKLTRILQNSLGGNSRTLAIFCINPLNKCCVESLNTLKYASRTKLIKNSIKKIEKIDKFKALQESIDELKQKDNKNKSILALLKRWLTEPDANVMQQDMSNILAGQFQFESPTKTQEIETSEQENCPVTLLYRSTAEASEHRITISPQTRRLLTLFQSNLHSFSNKPATQTLHSNDSKVQLINEESAELNKELKELRYEVAKLSSQEKNLLAEFDSERGQLFKQMNDQQQLYQSWLVANNDKISQLQSTITQLSQAKPVETLQAAIKEKENAIVKLQEEIHCHSTNELSNKEQINQARESLQQQHNIHQQAQQAIADLKQDLMAMKDENSVLKAQFQSREAELQHKLSQLNNEISENNSAINRFTDEINHLATKLLESSSLEQRLNTELTTSQQSLQDKTSHLHNAQQEITALNQAISDRQQEISIQAAQAEQLKLEIGILKGNVQQLSQSNQEAAAELIKLRQLISSKEASLQQFEAGFSGLKNELLVKHEELHSQQQHISTLNVQIEQFQFRVNELTTAKQNLSEELTANQQRMMQAQDCIQELQLQIHNKELILNQSNTEAEQLRAKTEELTALYNSLQLNLNQTEALLKEKESCLVSVQLDDAQQQLQLDKKIKDLQEELNHSTKQLQVQLTNSSNSDKDLRELDKNSAAKINELNTALAAANRSITDIELSAQTKHRDLQKEIELRVEEKEMVLQSSAAALTQAQQQTQKLQAQINASAQIIEKLQLELTQTQNSSAQQIHQLNSDLSNRNAAATDNQQRMQAELVQLHKKLAITERLFELEKAKCNNEKKENKTVVEELHKLKAEVADLQAQLARTHESFQQVCEGKKDLEQEIVSLQAHIAQRDALRTDEAHKEQMSLQRALNTLGIDLTAEKNLTEQLQCNLENNNEVLASAQATLDEKQLALQQCLDQNQSNQAQFAKEGVEILTQQRQAAEAQLHHLHTKITAIQAEKESLSNDVRKLREEIQGVELHCAQLNQTIASCDSIAQQEKELLAHQFEERIKRNEGARAEVEAKLVQALSELAVKESRLSCMNEELLLAADEIKVLKEEVDHKQQSIDELNGHIHSCSESSVELDQQLKELQAAVEQQQTQQAAALQAELVLKSSAMADLVSENESLKSSLSEKESIAAELKHKLIALDNELAGDQLDKAELQQRYNALKNEKENSMLALACELERLREFIKSNETQAENNSRACKTEAKAKRKSSNYSNAVPSRRLSFASASAINSAIVVNAINNTTNRLNKLGSNNAAATVILHPEDPSLVGKNTCYAVYSDAQNPQPNLPSRRSSIESVIVATSTTKIQTKRRSSLAKQRRNSITRNIVAQQEEKGCSIM
jgi:chromosome segregation ATPase